MRHRLPLSDSLCSECVGFSRSRCCCDSLSENAVRPVLHPLLRHLSLLVESTEAGGEKILAGLSEIASGPGLETAYEVDDVATSLRLRARIRRCGAPRPGAKFSPLFRSLADLALLRGNLWSESLRGLGGVAGEDVLHPVQTSRRRAFTSAGSVASDLAALANRAVQCGILT